jgi:hypothetical protein
VADLDDIKDDLKDVVDISKMISGVMAGDVETSLGGVDDKVKEIQGAISDAYETGQTFTIENTTFDTMQRMLGNSQTILANTIPLATQFTEQLMGASDTAEMLTSIQDAGTQFQQQKVDLQNELTTNTGLTANKVDEIQAKLAQFSEVEKFLQSLESSVSATSNLDDAINVAYGSMETFIDTQTTSLEKVNALQDELRRIESAVTDISSKTISFNPVVDTSALTNASEKIKEIESNVAGGNIMANLEITGDNEIEKLKGDLAAAQNGATALSDAANDFRKSLIGVSTESEALAKIEDARKIANQTISEITSAMPSQQAAVDSASKTLEIEKARLNALPAGTLAYETQKARMEEVEVTHIRAVNAVKSQQAELAEVQRFGKDYLDQQSMSLANAENIASGIAEIKGNTSDLISETSNYQTELQKSQDKLDQYGEKYRKLVKELGPTFDSAAKGIDSAKESILGIAGSIPIFGGMIENNLRKPFEDASKEITLGLGEGFKAFTQVISDKGSVTDAMTAGFEKMSQAIKSAGAALKAAFSGPMLLIGSILLLIGMAVKRFMDLEAKSLEFRQELGLAADSTKDIESAAADVNRELAGFGVTLDHAYEAANALTRELGSTMLVTKEQIKMVSMMNAGLGISAENAVGVYEVFKNLSGGSSEVAKNLSLTTVALSTAAGVPLDDVMGDIAGASETVYAMSRGTGVELAVAAIEARRLGTNIESISSAMEQQLDFESSITNEMKMASMLGQHISMDAMRQAAFAGDQVRYMEEQQKVMAQIGDLSEMNMYQRKSIAAAMGMEVGELMKMQTQTKALAALENGTAEQRKALAEYQKQRNAALAGETKSLAEQGMEILKQQQAENVRTRMAAAFNELVTELGSVLLPVVESAMNILVPIVSTLVKGFAKLLVVVELLMQPFIFIGNIISAITGDTEGLKKQFDGVGAAAFAIGGILLAAFTPLGGMLGKFLGKIPLIGGALEKVFSTGSSAGEKMFGKLSDKMSSLFGGDAEDASDGFFSGMKNKVKGMFGGAGPEVPGPLKKDGTPDMRFKANKESMKPSIPDLSDDAVPDVDPKKGDKFKEFIEKFNQIDMTQIIKAAAALVILSAALYVTAKALNEFNTVEWSSLVKGTLALGILIGGLYALSQVLDKAKSSLIKGAAALLIMGAALIPVAYAFNLMGSIDFVSVLLAGTAIAGFAVMAAVLGYVAPYIIAGSIALAVLGVALIPAAVAFNLFGAVNWGSVFLGILAIGVLAVAAAFMGSVAPLIIAGAIAIGALGLALIPFGIAAILAGAGMALIGFGIQLMVTGLDQLNAGHILMLYGLAGAIFMFALLSPVILIAGYSMLVFSAALALAGIGVMIFGFAMSLVVETLKELPAAAGGLFVFAVALAMLAPLTPLILLTAGALLFLGVAMLPLAMSMVILGAGIALLGLGFQMLRDSNAAGMLVELGFAMSFIAMMSPFIVVGAAALTILTAVLLPFSIAVAVAGLGMMLFGIGLNLTAEALIKLGDGAKYLIGFAIAVSIVGAMLPLIILGAIAMVILATALIPLGVAAMIAGVGLMAVGVGMDLMASALEDLDVGKLLGLAFTFAIMGSMIPLILLGAIAMGIMATAMIPLAVAAAVAGIGMYMFASAFEILADSLSKVTPESVLSLIGLGVAMMFLGAMAPFAILASLALAVFAIGLGAFGIAAAIVAPSMDILAKGFAILALSLEHIAATAMPALVGLTLLGLISPLLFVAAAGMAALAIPTLLFGAIAGLVAPSILLLSGAFYVLCESLKKIGEEGTLALVSLMGLALLAPLLLVAAAGITAVGASMMALAFGLFFLDEDDVAVLGILGEAMANIGKGAKDLDITSFTEALTTLVDDSFLSGIYLLGDAIMYLGMALSSLPTEKMQLFVDMTASSEGAMSGVPTGGTPAPAMSTTIQPPVEEESGGFLGGLFGGLFGEEATTEAATEASTIIQTQKAIVISEGTSGDEGGMGTESIGASVTPPTGEGGGFLGGLFDGLFGGEDKAAETSTIIQTQKAIVISEGGGESPQEQLDMPTGTDAGGGDSSLAEIIAQIVNAPAQNNAATGGGDSAGVEAKLDELIDLMKSGKIGVHMDGRKVESQLARVAP